MVDPFILYISLCGDTKKYGTGYIPEVLLSIVIFKELSWRWEPGLLCLRTSTSDGLQQPLCTCHNKRKTFNLCQDLLLMFNFASMVAMTMWWLGLGADAGNREVLLATPTETSRSDCGIANPVSNFSCKTTTDFSLFLVCQTGPRKNFITGSTLLTLSSGASSVGAHLGCVRQIL